MIVYRKANKQVVDPKKARDESSKSSAKDLDHKPLLVFLALVPVQFSPWFTKKREVDLSPR